MTTKPKVPSLPKQYVDNLEKAMDFMASLQPKFEKLIADQLAARRGLEDILADAPSAWDDKPVHNCSKTWSCSRCGSTSADGCIQVGCSACEASEPAPGSMLGQFGGKDHVVREVVNNLRDTALKYGATQQLRERLREAIEPLIGFGVIKAISEAIGDQPDLPVQPHTADSDKYKADLYEEVWAKARAMGYENVTMAMHDLAVAKQKAARWDTVLGAVCAEKDRRPEKDTYYFLLSRVVGRVPRGVDPMKGSVAGHFTDHIDNLIKAKPAVS